MVYIVRGDDHVTAKRIAEESTGISIWRFRNWIARNGWQVLRVEHWASGTFVFIK
jgi:hypothetical protein